MNKISRYEAQRLYDSMSTTQFKLKLNDRTDRDIIWWLREKRDNGESMQGTIKTLIRRQIAAEKST